MNRNFIILFVVSLFVFMANIWGTSIYILDEAKNSGCAMEMHQRGDWVVPTFNGELRTDKPPLHYFFMKIAYTAFGTNPFSARFFSAVMGVLTILSVFFFTRKIINEGVAFMASLMMVCSIQLAIQFHLAVPDPYLIFFLTTAWLSFYVGFNNNSPPYLYLFYVCVSLATLSKGPVAVVFSGLILFTFLLVQKKINWNEIGRLRIFQGILIFCVIVLPWYVVVGIQTEGEWLREFFFRHNVNRFTATMEGHGGFPLASFVIILAGLIPFSLFFPQMIKVFWNSKKENPFLMFCFIIVMVIGIFFSFSRTILPTYPEPALPFFSIMMAFFFYRIAEDQDCRKKLFWSGLMYVIIALAMPVVIWFVLKQDSTLYDLTGLAVYFIVLPCGAISGLIFIRKDSAVKTFYSYVISNVLFLVLFFYVVFPQVDKKNPVLKSLPLLTGTSKSVVYYNHLNPAYVMALQRTIPQINSTDTLKMLNEVFVISQKRYLPELDRLGYDLVFEGRDLFEKPVTIIMMKSKQD